MIHHIISRRRAKRRFAQQTLRARDINPLAPGEIPTNLSNPTGSIFEPGRTIWKFDSGAPPKLHFDGGAIITTARLVPLFWGEFWQTAANPSVTDIHRAIAQILPSPYLSEATQYGFESLTLEPGGIVISPGPPFPTFSSEDVKNMVWALIDDDHFPEPDEEGGRIVYMVFAPNGSNYDVSEAAGAHGEANDFDFPSTDHAWVGWCNYSSLDGITEIFTHELVEILTDPEPPSGWTVEGFPDEHNEIVDVCFHQIGMVSGHIVSAYYSDRLKACVVPTFPHQFSLSVSTKEEGFGPGFEEEGFTQTTKLSNCFNGGYDWTLFGQQRRVTVIAAAVGYVEPEFEWKVNGTPMFTSAGAPVAPTLPITSPADTALDPLSMITTLPHRMVTAKVAAGGNVLVIESQLGEPPGDFEVVCRVTEKKLPSGYHTERQDTFAITVAGSVRVMDERFQKDLANCLHLKSVLARELIEEVVIPKIDLGDPPPPWVVRVFGDPGTEIEQQAQHARFLARVVEAVEPELAATLRHLAASVISLAHATNVVITAEADQTT